MTPEPTSQTAQEGEFVLGQGAKTQGFNMPEDMLNRLNAMVTSKGGEPAVQESPKETPAEPTKSKPTPTPPPSQAKANEPKPAPVAAQAAATTQPKPEAASPAPPVKGAAGEAATAATDPEPLKGPKPLREAYERAQAKVTELESGIGATTKEKLDALNKLAEAEKALTAAQRRIADEFEPLRKVHEETAKKLQEREEALRIRDYTATAEWHERYVKPVHEAQQEALQFIGELVVTKGDGSTVPASQEHLNYILGAPNANEAARRAEELFGNQPAFTGQLVNYRQRLRALAGKQQEALQKAQLESAEWAKRTQAQQLEQQSAIQQHMRDAISQHLVKVADPEEQAALSEGESFANELDMAAQSGNVTLWGSKLGQARADLMNLRVERVRNQRLAAENAELKRQLEDYRGTEPKVETRNGGAPPPAPEPTGLGDSMRRRLEASLMPKILERAR